MGLVCRGNRVGNRCAGRDRRGSARTWCCAGGRGGRRHTQGPQLHFCVKKDWGKTQGGDENGETGDRARWEGWHPSYADFELRRPNHRRMRWRRTIVPRVHTIHVGIFLPRWIITWMTGDDREGARAGWEGCRTTCCVACGSRGGPEGLLLAGTL